MRASRSATLGCEAVEDVVHLVHPVAAQPDGEAHVVDVVALDGRVSGSSDGRAVRLHLGQLAEAADGQQRHGGDDGDADQQEDERHGAASGSTGSPCAGGLGRACHAGPVRLRTRTARSEGARVPLRLGSHVFADGETVVMAIVNRTPDSFYDQGATFADARRARRPSPARSTRARGSSTSAGVKAGPGAEVDAAEEIRRTASRSSLLCAPSTTS